MNLKVLLPYESFVLTTALSAEEVHKRIYEIIWPGKSGTLIKPSGRSGKLYEGEIWQNSFSISRVIGYRNSFLPLITGKIISVGRSTEIKISMKLHPGTMIFISCWLSIVGIFCLAMFITGLSNSLKTSHLQFSPEILIPFGMLIFGYMLTIFGFKGESSSSKTFLVKLFDGQEMK